MSHFPFEAVSLSGSVTRVLKSAKTFREENAKLIASVYSLYEHTVTPHRIAEKNGEEKNEKEGEEGEEREGEGEGEGESDSEGVEREREVIGRRKRLHLRSRNPYIDRHLKDMTGDDDFADLEDFIVT